MSARRGAPSLGGPREGKGGPRGNPRPSGGGSAARSIVDAEDAVSGAPPESFSVPRFEDALARDLFGEPVRPGAGLRGRPHHVPTDATRARVAELRGAGLSHAAIARDIGVSDKTLRLNYAAELGSGSQTWRRRALTKPED